MINSNPDTIKEKYKNNKLIFNNEENINNQSKSYNSSYKLKYDNKNYNVFYFNPSLKDNYFYFFNNLSDSNRINNLKIIDKNNTNIKNNLILPNKEQNVLDYNNNYFTVFNYYFNKNLKNK